MTDKVFRDFEHLKSIPDDLSRLILERHRHRQVLDFTFSTKPAKLLG